MTETVRVLLLLALLLTPSIAKAECDPTLDWLSVLQGMTKDNAEVFDIVGQVTSRGGICTAHLVTSSGLVVVKFTVKYIQGNDYISILSQESED